MKQKMFLILLILFLVVIIGCQKDKIIPKPNEENTSLNSDLYNFCLENKGIIFGSNPIQCNYQKLVYFENTNNAINIQFCNSYYDGCNTCSVNNGTINGCTKIACHKNNIDTPRCLNYDEPIIEGRIIPNEIHVNFTCDNNDLQVVFNNVDHFVNVTNNFTSTILPQVVSGSGAKYSNQKITFFTKGKEVFVYDAKNESVILFKNCVTI